MTKEEAIEAFRNLLNDIDKDNHLFVGTINPELLSMAIDALKTQLSTESTTKGTTFEWISCKDRLPETNGEYLVTAETNNGLEVYQDTYWAECMWDDSGDKVIAWAKMPEPWKGEQDD